MTRPKSRSRCKAFAPDPDAPDRCCDIPGCEQPAGYRAPRSRDNLSDYYWFCLDHVRSYNAGWDYYKGMTPAQIEAHLRSATSWDRPSWRLGHVGSYGRIDEEKIIDPLDILNGARMRRAAKYAKSSTPPGHLVKPLDVMGLQWPLTLETLKARYKNLAKKYHPDANAGNVRGEERIKIINAAYTALKSHLLQNISSPAD